MAKSKAVSGVVRRVLQNLAKVGSDHEQIANSLKSKGIKGKKCVDTECPLANYLNSRSKKYAFKVGKYYIQVFKKEDVKQDVTGKKYASWDDELSAVYTPDACTDFIRHFDAGLISDLIV